MSGRFMAILALARNAEPTGEAIIAKVRKLFPQFREEISIPGSTSARQPANMLKVGAHTLVILSIAAAPPPGTFDLAVTTNRTWKDAGRALSKTKAHIVVTEFNSPEGFGGRTALAAALTMVSAAIADLTSAIGIYWPLAETLAKPNELKSYAQRALQGGPWPLELWIGTAFFEGESLQGQPTYGLLTAGLRGFMEREIEFEPSLARPETIAERMLGVLVYLLAEGPVLKDSDTLGISQTESIRIRHLAQGFRPEIPIYSLRFETLDQQFPN